MMIALVTLSLAMLSTAVSAAPAQSVTLLWTTPACDTIHDLQQFELFRRAGNVRGVKSVQGCRWLAKGKTVQVLDQGDTEDWERPARVSQGYVDANEVRNALLKK
jgi:hypothetical protein